MFSSGDGLSGYKGRWAWVDLSTRTVRVTPAEAETYRDYLGGRGVQARLIYERIMETGPVCNPLGPENRIIIGNAAANDTLIPTAGRGSCSFIGPMARSPVPVRWIQGHRPLFGLITHSSCGGIFPNMLKRAGFDQLIIDGRSESPVRIVAAGNEIRIVDAEDDLFENVNGQKALRLTSAITNILERRYAGSSTVCVGPAGWSGVEFACLTADHNRNFGRGGAGAVFGSKNLVAVTAYGRDPVEIADPDHFRTLVQDIDALIKRDVDDPAKTVSFRPETGTTWWLDRAFYGGYMGKKGGYLSWKNFDEGSFDPAVYTGISTAAFLEISGQQRVCNRCRHIMCTRAARINSKRFAGKGIRPEFETIALMINCCLIDRDAIFHINNLCNDLGIDTMTFGSVMAAVMELAENGYLDRFHSAPAWGNAGDMIDVLKSLAYQSNELARIVGRYTDYAIGGIAETVKSVDMEILVRCFTSSFGGLGYAGVQPKAFPGMFAAYATSNRGRGDHTYAWTIQAEEAGLEGADQLAGYIAEAQVGKALLDSLGLCDFFTADVTSDLFLGCYYDLTGIAYTVESFKECGRRIYTLERHINNIQGRDRAYDAYVPIKMTEPLIRGALQGRRVNPAKHNALLDAYYAKQGWTNEGVVDPELLKKYRIE